MEALALQFNAYELSQAGRIILDKISEAYKENLAAVVCGLLSINGFSNTYNVYEQLNK
jgi:hypothetical protein